MDIAKLAHLVFQRMGTASGLRLRNDATQLSLSWSGGELVCRVRDSESGPALIGAYRHGPHTDLILTLSSQGSSELAADCIVQAAHALRAGRAVSAQWQFGLGRPTITTQIADLLDSDRIGVSSVDETSLYATCPREEPVRDALVMWHGSSSQWSLVVDPTDDQGGRESLSRQFPASVPPYVVAHVTSYWLAAGPENPDPGPPGLNMPFPMARLGLAPGAGAGFEPIVDRLHREGMEMLRVDLCAVDHTALPLPGRDILTFRDRFHRGFLLTRGIGEAAVWTLHALVLFDPDETDGDAGPYTVAQPWTANESDPYSVPVTGSDPMSLSTRILQFVASLPPPGASVAAYVVPQAMPGLAWDVIRQPYLEDAITALSGSLLAERPEPSLIRTPEDAELAAAEWMRAMGYRDAVATPIGPDSGVDVISTEAVAQVKAQTVPVGRPALQGLYGVAAAVGKDGLFFSLAGYTAEAHRWADEARLPLFTFDYQGVPSPVNDAAQALWRHARLG